MGKLEKIGRSILKKLGSKHRRAGSSSVRDVTSSSDEEQSTNSIPKNNNKKSGSMPDMSYLHRITVVPMEDEDFDDLEPAEMDHPSPGEMSAGYATDDTALSSLSPLDVKRRSSGEFGEGSESQGYYSTAELSPREEIMVRHPRIIIDSPQQPRFIKNQKQYPKVNVSGGAPGICKSISDLKSTLEVPTDLKHRSATLQNLTEADIEDPIDRFMKSAVYKTKMVTTVFEATNGGIEEIYEDVIHEIDRWFETKNMMAVACEMHWSTPREKRNRQAECRIKEKLLGALRENNKRLLYLKGMGHGKTPIKLAESKTVENITRDKETDSVRGIYQRSYTRLLPYLHQETPEWHSQYWQLSDFDKKPDSDIKGQRIGGMVQPDPQQFLFGSEPDEVLSRTSLVSLNIIGLSILQNSRQSCTSSMSLAPN